MVPENMASQEGWLLVRGLLVRGFTVYSMLPFIWLGTQQHFRDYFMGLSEPGVWKAKWEFIQCVFISKNRFSDIKKYFFISKNRFFYIKKYFLISENRFFLYQKIDFLISKINFLISDNIF